LLTPIHRLHQNIQEVIDPNISESVKPIEFDRKDEISAMSHAYFALVNKIHEDRTKLTEQKDQLADQKEELQNQNEELMQTTEHLRETSHQLESKSNELESNNKLLTKALTSLELKQAQIEDSIRYAETIQREVLPSEKYLNKLFSKFGILFKPRDIVSGDFYWAAQINHPVNGALQYSFFVVADCTGHGVPGAFMSLISSTLLSRIVLEKEIYEPKEILNKLHKYIVQSIDQEDGRNDDGLDLAVIRINENKRTEDMVPIVFAGAKRPLFLVNQESKQLDKIKGTNRAIGGKISKKAAKREFEQVSLNILPENIIFLMSDGVSDQNGTELPKFGETRLGDHLVQNVDLPLKEQTEIISIKLEEYMGDIPQRDDMLLVGLKLL
jgi:serine phosphatase RsbU (regulator of sigma subunit)